MKLTKQIATALTPACLLLSACTMPSQPTPSLGTTTPTTTVPTKFTPSPAGPKYWTKLTPLPARPGTEYAEAHLHLGDQFPVQTADGTTLFHIQLASGNDSRLNLKIQDATQVQQFNLPRSQWGINIKVNDNNYTIAYPVTETLATTANQKSPPTTTTAMIVVTH